VLTLALILAFSPGEKESPWRVLIVRLIVRPIQPQVFQKDGARFSFLSLAHRMGEGGRRPGEGLSLAGMMEDVKPFSFGNAFWRDSENGNRDSALFSAERGSVTRSGWTKRNGSARRMTA
jgi:hypothetical protein